MSAAILDDRRNPSDDRRHRADGSLRAGRNGSEKFIVEGEQHYWVNVAIDRFTGQVIDRQIEVVKE